MENELGTTHATNVVLDSGNSRNVSTLSSLCTDVLKTIERLVQIQERQIEVQQQQIEVHQQHIEVQQRQIEVIGKGFESLIQVISANKSTG